MTQTNTKIIIYISHRFQDDLWQDLASDLLVPLFLHCMVNIGNDKFMVIGGQNGKESFSAETFIFDSNSKIWLQGPDLKFGRRSHSCSTAVHQVPVSYGNPVTFIVGCRGASQLGGSLLGNPTRV